MCLTIRHRLLALLLFSLLSVTPGGRALARSSGGDGSGGGLLFVCRQNEDVTSYLADTYPFFSSQTRAEKTAIRLVSTIRAIEIILSHLKNFDPAFGVELDKNIKSLKFTPVEWVQRIADNDIQPTEIPPGCKTLQIAEQFLSGPERDTVRYSWGLYWSLNSFERAFFIIHEGYVRSVGSQTRLVRARIAPYAKTQLFAEVLADLEREASATADSEKAVALLCENTAKSVGDDQEYMDSCRALIPLLIQNREIRFADIAKGKFSLADGFFVEQLKNFPQIWVQFDRSMMDQLGYNKIYRDSRRIAWARESKSLRTLIHYLADDFRDPDKR